MQQLLAVWNALDLRKRIIVVGATLGVFAAVLGLARMAAQPSMALLYAGLEPGPAGEVIEALEARGVVTEVRGGAIHVPAAERDALRMTLAAEGLPSNSSKGYELLDGLSGFGTTAQMFDAAYWRAKEGELARTIVSAPAIRSARVHIAIPNPQTFRNRSAPSASVTVATADGTLSASHAKALKYLVSSAVPGLSPENVSVIDARGGLVISGNEASGAAGETEDRANRLRHNVERLLEARVGYGNAVVEVAIDRATESEKIFERSFDPDGRVAIASETEESSTAASDSQAGGVTVASNLPAGDADGGSGQSSSNNSETRERINYEVPETTREILRAPGAVRRISVAVLVDGIRGVDANGAPTWEPRSQEELAALHDLVASAVGYDETRGDSITIRSLEFEPLAVEGSEAAGGVLAALQFDTMALIRLATLAVVALVLGLFVLRPIFSSRAVPLPAIPAPATEAMPGASELPALTGEIEDGGALPGDDLAVVSDLDFGTAELPDLPALGGADPVERLRALIEERQAETVEILRGWMEDDREETM
ncbi:MAG: flagellar M-ring protein FliF [Rhodobacterales bacterium]|nr:MAG: flagellar M-ring protein FliF [Rhodobacterales bacterium]